MSRSTSDSQRSLDKKPLIKVLIVISNLSHGGAERQVIELANRASANMEIHVCVLSTQNPMADQLKHQDRLHIIPKRSRYDWQVVKKLTTLIKEHQFHVVHGFMYDAEIASRFAGRRTGTPVIVGSERNSKNNFSRLKTWVYRWTASKMDLCVANSNAGVAFSHREFGIAKDKYTVIYNGVNTQRFVPRASTLSRDELSLPAEVKLIGMVGSFKVQKNHVFLLQAAARLKHLDFRLLLVGSRIEEGREAGDDYYQMVQDKVAELGLQDKCVFIDARGDVEEIYTLCDFTVLPSLFEGTPNVALESMACGVPIIATDVADNRYVIPDGKAGFIVPLNDVDALSQKMQSLLEDESQRDAMASYAREWVENEFSLDKMASSFEQEYRQALAKKGL